MVQTPIVQKMRPGYSANETAGPTIIIIQFIYPNLAIKRTNKAVLFIQSYSNHGNIIFGSII